MILIIKQRKFNLYNLKIKKFEGLSNLKYLLLIKQDSYCVRTDQKIQQFLLIQLWMVNFSKIAYRFVLNAF